MPADSDEGTQEEPKTNFKEGALFAFVGAVASFIIVVVIGVSVLAIGSNRSNAETDQDTGGTAVTAAQGEAIFQSRCAACHGSNGEGGVGPAMAGIADRFPDIAAQIVLVTDGQNAMPAFGSQLTPEEIEAVVTYEREILGK